MENLADMRKLGVLLSGQNNNIVAIIFHPAQTLVRYKGRAYVRIGATTYMVTQEDKNRLIEKKNRNFWERRLNYNDLMICGDFIKFCRGIGE